MRSNHNAQRDFSDDGLIRHANDDGKRRRRKISPIPRFSKNGRFFFYQVQNTNIVSTRRLEMEKERGRGNERRQHAAHETPQTRLKRKRRFDPTLRRGLSQSFTKPVAPLRPLSINSERFEKRMPKKKTHRHTLLKVGGVHVVGSEEVVTSREKKSRPYVSPAASVLRPSGGFRLPFFSRFLSSICIGSPVLLEMQRTLALIVEARILQKRTSKHTHTRRERDTTMNSLDG